MRVLLIATIAAAIFGGPMLAIAATPFTHADFLSAALNASALTI